MSKIVFNPDTNEIEFEGKISSFLFYSQLFPALSNYYRINGNSEPPTFSFKLVKEFDAIVLPNLIGIGILINRSHGKQIPLEIIRTLPTKFLDTSMFFNYSGKPKIIEEEYFDNNQVIKDRRTIGFDIYSFNPGLLGFYNNSLIKFDYNAEHKIHVYDNISYEYYKNYTEIKDKNKLEAKLDSIRTKISKENKIRVRKHFSSILKRFNRAEEDVQLLLKILNELICNSKLYSFSSCVAMMQSKTEKFYNEEKGEYYYEKRTNISVSDIGDGFEGSFTLKPNFEKFVTDNFVSDNKEKLKNYLLIFDALHYSMSKNRENLYSLLNHVIQNGGKMRIHYNNVQVIFTSNRCENCQIIPIKCAGCLLNKLTDDIQISPVRFFSNTYKGIHIEVELAI